MDFGTLNVMSMESANSRVKSRQECSLLERKQPRGDWLQQRFHFIRLCRKVTMTGCALQIKHVSVHALISVALLHEDQLFLHRSR